MIKTNGVESEYLKHEILEIKKSLELNRKNIVKKQIYQRNIEFDLVGGKDSFQFEFDGVEGDILEVDFSCDINLESEYLLNVYFNNIKVLSRKYSNRSVINEHLVCVLSCENGLRFEVESDGREVVFAQILCVGKMFNLPSDEMFLVNNANGIAINTSKIGNKSKIKYYANFASVFEDDVESFEYVNGKILDSKLINLQTDSGEKEFLVYLNKDDGLFLCADVKRILISSENILKACIIPVNHQLCSVIVAYILDNQIKLVYIDKSLRKKENDI